MSRNILFLALLPICLALFEDQVGKFDWRTQYVGCPVEVLFDRTSFQGHNLLVSTKEKVFSSITLGSGAINWRRIQENNGNTDLPIVSDDSNVYSLSDGGRVVRVWNKVTGAMVWQNVLIDLFPSVQPSLLLHKSSLITCTGGAVSSFSLSGTEEWNIQAPQGDWSSILSFKDKLVYVSLTGTQLSYSAISDSKLNPQTTVAIGTRNSKCLSASSFVVCHDDNTVHIVDVATGATKQLNVANIKSVKSIEDDIIAVIAESSTTVYSLSKQSEIKKLSKSADAVSSVEKHGIAIVNGKILGFDKASGKETFSLDLPFSDVKVKEVYSSAVKKEIELLVVYQDCRIEFLVIASDLAQVQSEWHREEGLARLISVEMVDLPLSESQRMIEDEFATQEGNIISSFIRRVISQVIQVQKYFFRTIHQIASLSRISSKVGSFSQLIDIVKNTPKDDLSDDNSLERDYFNLHKIIVVVSLDGSVFGIDSEGGRTVWKLWLGERFASLKSDLGEERIPLFIQRSTALYQLNGQAAVAFQDAKTKAGCLVFFNPITGAIVERKQLSSQIKSVNLLPITDTDHLQTLLIIEQGNRVSLYPPITSEIDSTVAEMYFSSITSKGLEGFVLSLKTLKTSPTWSVDLNLGKSEKIISVKSKPLHEKVHSQGRVLIDRNVQYKYVNPNLIAVATLDDVSQNLMLYMIDSVTGQIVHTAKTTKVAEPIHVVHCENWVVYSYWSEKSRRTEIGIIELYEGEELTNEEQFDSFVPTKKAPEVNAQSYVYAHGVDAMAVTETEQGLTTRSILLALPFGGIHEVSRKLIDANRPLELTQEMREEMMIPYMPEIRIATEDMVNYNQTVYRVRGIKTAASGLESTSLMLAYGVDLFYTRLNPSGTFDILKDDFDHLLISLVLFGLIVGSIISKRLARNNALKAAWS